MVDLKELQKGVEHNLTKDKFLAPMVMLFTTTDTLCIDAQEGFSDDETKDKFVASLCEQIKQYNVFRFIVISECWGYKTDTVAPDKVANLLKEGNYRDKLNRIELYQILDVTKNNTTMLSREFTRQEDESIVFGEQQEEASKIELVRFKPLQDVLASLN